LRDLDRLTSRGCDIPGCCGTPGAASAPVYLHAACHAEDPVWLWYADGVLVAECSRCRKVVLRVRPAADGEEPAGAAP